MRSRRRAKAAAVLAHGFPASPVLQSARTGPIVELPGPVRRMAAGHRPHGNDLPRDDPLPNDLSPGQTVRAAMEETMKSWKRPRVREISCGMEINGYFPAEI